MVSNHKPHDEEDIVPSDDGDKLETLNRKKKSRALMEKPEIYYQTQGCEHKIEEIKVSSMWKEEVRNVERFFCDTEAYINDVSTSKKPIEYVRDFGDNWVVQTEPLNSSSTLQTAGVWECLEPMRKTALTALDDELRLTNETLQTTLNEADEGEGEVNLRGAQRNTTGAFPRAAALRDAFQRTLKLTSAIWEPWTSEHQQVLNWQVGYGKTESLKRGDTETRECIVSGRYKQVKVDNAVLQVRQSNPQPGADSRTGLRAGECSDNTATEAT